MPPEPLPSILSEIRFYALVQHKPQSLRLFTRLMVNLLHVPIHGFPNVTNIGNIVTIIGNIVKRYFLISLSFFLFSFCICKLGVFLVGFWRLFDTKKKSTDSCLLVQLLENWF